MTNPDLQMSQYADLLAGKYTPSDLRYGVQSLANYRRISNRLLPLTSQTYVSGNPIVFRLPPNCLIPLDSVRIIGDITATVVADATGVSFSLNKDLDMCLFQSLICRTGGRPIDNAQNYYSQIGKLYAQMISEDNYKSVRSALVHSYDALTTSNLGTTVAGSGTGTATFSVCVKDFLGFLNSGYTISTTQEFLPNFEIAAVLNPVENIIQASNAAHVASASYKFENVYLVHDIIQYSDPNPYQMALARVSGLGIPLSMKFKNYYSVARSGMNSTQTLALNMASHCLQRLYAIIRSDTTATGIQSQDLTTCDSYLYTRSQNGLSNCRFIIGDLQMPTFWDANSGNTPYALYNLCQAFGLEKDTVHGIAAIKDFQNYLDGSSAGAIDANAAPSLFANKYYVFCQSLDHCGDYPEGMLSGLNTRNIAQDIYFNFTLTTSSTVLVVGESAAILTILPNSEIDVQY